MTRANRVTIQSTDNGFKGVFYRTHTKLATIESADTAWKADPNANSTTNREGFRSWLISNADAYEIAWAPELQTQAWARKYNVYETDEQVSEDAVTLVMEAIERLAVKGKHTLDCIDITVDSIVPKQTTLTYVKNGRYEKNGAWCMAEISLTISAILYGQQIEIPYTMEMVSGQIKKPKTTIADWNEILLNEIGLQNIEIPSKEDAKTA